MEIYGLHVMLRLSNIENRTVLSNAESINHFLQDLVGRLGMRILSGPMVAQEEGDLIHAGYSGVVLLYESHAAIHTYCDIGEAYLDVFSCKPFSVHTVEEILKEYLGNFKIVEQSTLNRGIHWGVNVKQELNQWSEQH